MNYKNILDNWVNETISDWLDKRGETLLHPSVQPLIKKLRHHSLDSNHFGDAWHCIEQIEKLYDQIHKENNKPSARMFLECGVAAYRMGDAHAAISFLTRSVSSFTEDHDKGVACWLLGCVYWYVNNPISALAFWEDGFRHFKEQSAKSGRGSTLEYWYISKIQEMESAIKSAAEYEEPPAIVKIKGSRTTKKHAVQSLPVLGQIPAGTPSGIWPIPVDFMNTDKVCLGAKDHRIISLLHGENIVNIPPGQHFFILQVYGNSMNACKNEPIEHNDYVILREQNTADNGDIVAALILSGGSVDDRATLKRFVRKGDKIQLIPESDDLEFQKPIYIDRIFTKFDDDFQIRGVAIAVLKPL